VDSFDSLAGMNSDLHPVFLSGQNRSHLHTPLSVVALYDGGDSAPRVTQAREQLLSLAGTQRRMAFHAWPFHHLEALATRSMARHITEQSSVILLASASGSAVPDHVGQWLDQSLIEQRDRRAFIVALEDSGALCDYAGRLASRWGTQHLCCADFEKEPHRQLIAQAIEERLEEDEDDEVDARHEAVQPPTPKQATSAVPESVIITAPHLREQIRMRAYHLWLQAGSPGGQELDFWLRAERDFLHRPAADASTQEHW
jgi:hypothetical protein